MDDKDDRFSFEGEIESVLLSSTAKITGGSMTGNDKRNIVYAEMEIEEQAQGIIDTIIPALYSVLQPGALHHSTYCKCRDSFFTSFKTEPFRRRGFYIHGGFFYCERIRNRMDHPGNKPQQLRFLCDNRDIHI